MPTYRSRVHLPENVTHFLEAMSGPGKISIASPTHGIFEFEAEDLWDAANIVNAVERAVASNGNGDEVGIYKPVEVNPTETPLVLPVERMVVSDVKEVFVEDRLSHNTQTTGGWGRLISREGVEKILAAHGVKVIKP